MSDIEVKKVYVNYDRYDPFRTVSWRFDRVLRMVERYPNPGRSTRRDDKFIRGLRNFILRYRQYDPERRETLKHENPGLYGAYQIHERRPDNAETAILIEARLLAKQTTEEIAAATCTLPEIVYWYEKLFFNVQDRLGAHDWILKQALIPALIEADPEPEDNENNQNNPAAQFRRKPLSEPFFDGTLKFFAYYGGPIMLNFMISGFQQGTVVRSQDGIADWLEGFMGSAIYRRAAQAIPMFEVNKYNVMELFATFTRIVEIRRSIEGQEKQTTAIEQNVSETLLGMTWAVGKEGETNFEGTPVLELDNYAAELRDDELLIASTGKRPSTIDGIEKLRLSEVEIVPAAKEGKAHANPKS